MVDASAPPPTYLDASLLKVPSPIYSKDPLVGERSISYRPRHGLQMLNTSEDDVFIQKFDTSTTVLFNGQAQSSKVLSYGRRGRISGSLHFSDSSLITEVSLEVKGRIELNTLAGYRNQTLISDSISLYSRSTDSEHIGCHDSLPFAYSLPQHVKKVQEKQYELPPSYVLTRGNPGEREFIKVEYSMHFVVTRMVHRRMPKLTNTKKLTVDFDYIPRTRPSRPLLDLDTSLPFRSTLKGCPEEWREFVHDVTVAKGLDPVVCQMYVPSVGAFAIQDGIPFFLQITGCPSSLKLLSTRKTSPTKTSHVQVPHHHYPFPASESESKSEAEVGVRVTVLRQIAMNFGADLVPRHSTIGHAKLEAIPPALSQEENLNWQGTLKIDDSIKNGRFEAPHLAVHDFILLEITLPNGSVVKNGHPICLGTDSWSEASFTPGSWI